MGTSSSHVRIGEEIGKGAYGAVFKGEYYGQPVAIKKVHNTLVDYARHNHVDYMRLISEFKRECELLQTLEHPHVVKFIEVFGENSQALLVMELLAETLDHHIQKRGNVPGPIGELEEAWICCQVADGLAYLHQHDPPVIHRDLTTRNILLTAKGVAKISDLGVAKFRPTELGYMSTKAPGCLPYMPPEALSSEPQYTEKLDVFSLGVVMMVTATCREPPSGLIGIGTVPEVERRKDHLRYVDSTHPLKPLIICCLDNDEVNRPSAHEVHNRLKVLPYPPSLTHREEKTMDFKIPHSPLVKDGRAKLQFCLLGGRNSGKYTFASQCVYDQTPMLVKREPNIVLQGATKTIERFGVSVDVSFWIYPLVYTMDWLFFDNNGAFIFVDLTNPNSIDEAKEIYSQWLKDVGDYEIPLMLVGSKSDEERAISKEALDDVAQSLCCKYQLEVSSYSNSNITEAINMMIDHCLFKHII